MGQSRHTWTGIGPDFFSGDERYTVTAWDKEDIDITDFAFWEEKLTVLQPDVVINAAAYNAVDLCEEDDAEYKQALLLNRDVPGFLAGMSGKNRIFRGHYSTDYVFDGAC